MYYFRKTEVYVYPSAMHFYLDSTFLSFLTAQTFWMM